MSIQHDSLGLNFSQIHCLISGDLLPCSIQRQRPSQQLLAIPSNQGGGGSGGCGGGGGSGGCGGRGGSGHGGGDGSGGSVVGAVIMAVNVVVVVVVMVVVMVVVEVWWRQ